MKIILGSQSKGRKKMMEEMGLEFEVMPANMDEKVVRHDDPKILVMLLARAKAEAIKGRINEPAILITSDQVVMCNGELREKPESEQQAREFLQSYNNYPAETVTSVFVANLATGKSAEAVDTAKVHFKQFSKDDINDLIAKGELFHLAGAFNIDDDWAKYVDQIEGTRDSVIGLPKEITKQLIKQVSDA